MQICVEDAQDVKRRHKSGHTYQEGDMGEVIGFKRKKLSKFIPDEVLPPINLAEPITADKFPAWDVGDHTAPCEYCAPESDGACLRNAGTGEAAAELARDLGQLSSHRFGRRGSFLISRRRISKSEKRETDPANSQNRADDRR